MTESEAKRRRALFTKAINRLNSGKALSKLDLFSGHDGIWIDRAFTWLRTRDFITMVARDYVYYYTVREPLEITERLMSVLLSPKSIESQKIKCREDLERGPELPTADQLQLPGTKSEESQTEIEAQRVLAGLCVHMVESLFPKMEEMLATIVKKLEIIEARLGQQPQPKTTMSEEQKDSSEAPF